MAVEDGTGMRSERLMRLADVVRARKQRVRGGRARGKGPEYM